MQLKSKYVKIVCSVLMAVAPLLQPLYVSADTITSANIIGTNVYTEPISSEYIASTNNTAVNNTALVHIEVILDKAYLGWVNMGTQVNYQNYYYGANPSYWGSTSKTVSGNYYVNGSTINIDVPISWNSSQLGYQMGNPGHLPESSSDVVVSITNQSNVTPIGDLSTLQDILEVLQDINNNVSIDILDELQNIVSNTSLANDYLELLTKMRQYNFPIESLSFISQFAHLEFNDLFSKYSYSYPVYNLNNSNSFRSLWMSPNYRDVVVIFGIDKNLYNLSTFNTYFDAPNIKIESISSLFRNDYLNSFSIVKIIFDINNGNFVSFTPKQNINFIPIYLNYCEYDNLSTDFALIYGLNNKLLKDLNIIANGNTQSNQSASSESAANQQFASDSQELMDFEDNMSNDLDNRLQQINTNFDVGNTFGSNFLTSAEWVRNQFNTITNNTPFGTFISFSLLIGFSLLLVGKFL